jgi:hypothetical protein
LSEDCLYLILEKTQIQDYPYIKFISRLQTLIRLNNESRDLIEFATSVSRLSFGASIVGCINKEIIDHVAYLGNIEVFKHAEYLHKKCISKCETIFIFIVELCF